MPLPAASLPMVLSGRPEPRLLRRPPPANSPQHRADSAHRVRLQPVNSRRPVLPRRASRLRPVFVRQQNQDSGSHQLHQVSQLRRANLRFRASHRCLMPPAARARRPRHRP